MDELTKYVIDTLDQKEGIHNEIDEAITNLKSRGVSSKEIMDLLQAGYAKVANEEISKRR